MTIVGYRCTQQVLFDIGRGIYAIESAQAAPDIYRKSVSESTRLLKAQARTSLEALNSRLSGLPLLKDMTLQANKSLEETRTAIIRVQNLIEGYRNLTGGPNTSYSVTNTSYSVGRNPCTFIDDLTSQGLKYDTELMVWRMAADGSESPTVNPEGYHSHSDGLPSVLPNTRPSPTCSEHSFFSYKYSAKQLSCPCCRDCHVFDAAISATLAKMPTMQDLENLNTPVPYQLVGNDIDLLMRELDMSVQLVEDWMAAINIGLDGIKFSLRTLVKFMSPFLSPSLVHARVRASRDIQNVFMCVCVRCVFARAGTSSSREQGHPVRASRDIQFARAGTSSLREQGHPESTPTVAHPISLRPSTF